jgi:hypothetical protein
MSRRTRRNAWSRAGIVRNSNTSPSAPEHGLPQIRSRSRLGMIPTIAQSVALRPPHLTLPGAGSPVVGQTFLSALAWPGRQGCLPHHGKNAAATGKVRRSRAIRAPGSVRPPLRGSRNRLSIIASGRSTSPITRRRLSRSVRSPRTLTSRNRLSSRTLTRLFLSATRTRRPRPGT